MSNRHGGPISMNRALPRSNFADKLRHLGDAVLADHAAFQQRGRWDEFFQVRIGPGFDGRVILEVGCFDAAFLAKIAAQHPHTAFVGLDWKAKPIHDGARQIAERGQRNVVLLRQRGQDVFRIFGEREVNEVWLFHPDPFAGANELDHRLVNEQFLKDIHSILRDGSSTLTLKTDHAGYYQWVLGQPTIQRFQVSATSADFWNDPAALSHTIGRCFSGESTVFEKRFVKKRLPIYYLEMARKTGA